MVNKPTDINNAPKDATHWAPETDDWQECYYRFDNGLWYQVNNYWASDVEERPYGHPAKHWKVFGMKELKRPMTDLVAIEKFK